MKILYIAKLGDHDNQDENAIEDALIQLGHNVISFHEDDAAEAINVEADFCLFHKWPNAPTGLPAISSRMPSAFWYFDMVKPIDDDPTLKARSQHRIDWMKRVMPYVAAGFCTDGDWVALDDTGKLRHLMQGADERMAGYGTPQSGYAPLLFTGMIHHGRRRANHIAELKQIYGDGFQVFGEGGAHKRKHGRELADIFASTKIVIAPDGPNTDRYWSNRIYLTTGLGGFILHPYCAKLEEQYDIGEDLVLYNDREHLIDLIDHFLVDADERERFRKNGHEATMARHTYRHRCAELVSIMKELM